MKDFVQERGAYLYNDYIYIEQLMYQNLKKINEKFEALRAILNVVTV